ncbi:MAG: cyclase family protein [Anaerolineae bacterium]|nr:cyclase family protein [Anaerolineae bacterium]
MNVSEERISAQAFDELFQAVCNWGRWGPDDERGTLNYITGEHVRAAAASVQTGRSVSLALPLNTVAGPDNPLPAIRHMLQAHDVPTGLGEPSFALDFLGCACHGDCHTHMDALCHIAYKGQLYNGVPASSVTSQGPSCQDVTAFAHGIVGRGVLLDIPRLRGVPWIEPGEAIMPEELVAAERAEGVRLGPGDILVFRTGHHRRRLTLGPWDNSYAGEGKAGLQPSAIRLLHERQVAAFLPDGDGEAVPSCVDGVAYPIHVLQIAAMGMVVADSLQLEDLAQVCEEEGRWSFMVVAAPLRLPRGTGSLFNPIAIF